MTVNLTGIEPATIDCPFCKTDSYRTVVPFICSNCNKWVSIDDLPKKDEKPAPVYVGMACPHCNFDTEVLTKDLLDQFPLKDLVCPSCGKVIFLTKPEVKKSTYGWYGRGGFED